MRIKRIECLIDKSKVNAIIDDIFSGRYMFGSGSYVKRDEEAVSSQRKFYWAETKSGRNIFLRQEDSDSWTFMARFPGGSARFAWEISATITFHTTHSMKRGTIRSLRMWPDKK